MTEAYQSTVVPDGATFDKWMKYIKYKSAWNTDPIGFIINNSSSDPKVTIIDKNETVFDPPSDFFWNHKLFQWPKVLMAEDGTVTDDPKGKYNGENLTLTGPLDVMTYIPNGQVYYRNEEDAHTQIYKFAPYDSNHRGFDYHPNCFSGGGTKRDHFYTGTYPAGLKDDAGTLKFNSISGVQPWTGGQMRAIPFTSGNVEFTVGETITGAGGATGTVVGWHKSSGDWAATPGTAAGTVYVRNYGVDVSTATAFGTSETLTRTSGSATTNGTQTILSLTINDALTYASNKGTGWTISDVYSDAWIQGLFYCMMGTRNSQAKYGQGVVNLGGTYGSGYAGLLNGANYINDHIDSHGTGQGEGTDGVIPIFVNNIYDPWGGNWKFVAGINFNADGTVKLTKPDGTGIIAGVLPEGSYIELPEKASLTDGYIASTQKQLLGALTFIPLTAGSDDPNSSNVNKFCDSWGYPRNNSSILLRGGNWTLGLDAGIACNAAYYSVSDSASVTGARLKYIPQV